MILGEIEKGEQLGTFSKTYGTDGGFILKFNPDLKDKLIKAKFVIIEINNQQIPFFISDIHFRNNKSALVRFHDYNSEDAVEDFVGMAIYLPGSSTSENTRKQKTIYEKHIGYQVVDKNAGDIGIIEQIFDYPANRFFEVVKNDKKRLIPESNEFILKISDKKKEIRVDLPDGLLDLNN
ncbi:ribosome maturation factor RimM [Bacteroidota bacterium]